MNWIYVESSDNLPVDGQYVLCLFDEDYVGISVYLNEEWHNTENGRITIFNLNKRFRTSCEPKAWMNLPKG